MRILRQNWTFLVKHLPTADVADILYENKMLTYFMREDIMAQRNKSDEARLFLLILQRRGPNAFSEFRQGLETLGRRDILNVLGYVYIED